MLHERPIHLATVRFLTLALRPPVMFWHTPNGEKRDRKTAAMLKAMGTRAGMPDFFVLRAGRSCAPYLLGIELKAGGGRQSPDQLIAQHDLEACCARMVICRSVEEVEAALVEHGFTLHARIMGGGGIAKVAA